MFLLLAFSQGLGFLARMLKPNLPVVEEGLCKFWSEMSLFPMFANLS